MFTLEAFLLIEALHSFTEELPQRLSRAGAMSCDCACKALMWFLTPSRSLRQGNRGGLRQHLGLCGIKILETETLHTLLQQTFN